MFNKLINNKIESGEFEIFVEADVISKKNEFFRLDSLVNQLKRYITMLNKITPPRLGKLVPVVIVNGEITIALAMVSSDQGSLIESASGIEESARLEIIQKFKDAEKVSISSIKDGNKIAKNMVRSNISREELQERLEEVEDDSVVRNVIDLARDTKATLDFKLTSQTIGGNLEIPNNVMSSQKLSYCNCKIVSFLGNNDFVIEKDNLAKINITQNSIKNLIHVSCEPYSQLSVLMHLAGSVSATFDCDLRVFEEIKSRKSKLMVVNLPDPSQILSSVESNLFELKKSLQQGFDFN